MRNYPYQRGLQHFNGILFVPNAQDGTGLSIGGAWNVGAGVGVTHAAPAAGFATQFKRTLYHNDNTQNRELGPRVTAAGGYQFYAGSSANLGGFYLSTIFSVNAWAADTGRIFVGFTNSGAAVCTSDTIPNNTAGLSHISTDGQDIFWFRNVGSAGSTAGSTALTDATANAGILSAGSTLMFEMWAFPNSYGGVNTNFRFSQFNTSTNALDLVMWSAAGAGPANTTMLAPQVQMSNATTTAVSGFSIGVANIYAAPWSGETY